MHKRTKICKTMKAKRLLLLAVIMLGMVLVTTSCVYRWKTFTASDEKTVTDKRNLKDYEKIEINGFPTVYFTQADSFSVKVKGPESTVDKILTEVDGQTLVIRNVGKVGILNFTMDDDGDVAVFVTSPDLVSIRLNGSGDFVSKARIDTDNMKIVLRGSGDIEIKDLICDNCHVELVGSGDVEIDRLEAKDLSSSLIGSGSIDLGMRHVLSTNLALTGSGDINARFARGCGALNCELQGSGDINLSGQVERFKSQKRGSGDVDTEELTIKE